jgi:hypothetical protein
MTNSSIKPPDHAVDKQKKNNSDKQHTHAQIYWTVCQLIITFFYIEVMHFNKIYLTLFACTEYEECIYIST